MLGQSEGVVEDLLAELADVVANLVLDLGQFGLGLLSHLDHVELGVDVAWKENLSLGSELQNITDYF